jgi:hypothetical protein
MRHSYIVPLIAFGFVLVACNTSDSPVGPEAELVPTGQPLMDAASLNYGEDSFDFDFVESRCSAADGHEEIHMQGTFTGQWHRAWTSSDQYNYVANYSFRGTGTGLTSGASYKLLGQGTFGLHIGPDVDGQVPWIEREVSTINFIGQGGAPNMRENYAFNYTVNANGELVFDAASVTVWCQ